MDTLPRNARYNQLTLRNIPEELLRHQNRGENLKSCTVAIFRSIMTFRKTEPQYQVVTPWTVKKPKGHTTRWPNFECVKPYAVRSSVPLLGLALKCSDSFTFHIYSEHNTGVSDTTTQYSVRHFREERSNPSINACLAMTYFVAFVCGILVKGTGGNSVILRQSHPDRLLPF